MNARDVFVRRPACVSLWVAPSDAVFSRTREQLATTNWDRVERGSSGKPEKYVIFKKSQHSGACSQHAVVEAESAPEALKIILRTETSADGLVWWVIPDRLIAKSNPDDIESMFSPADAKPYRHQSDFNTLTLMRQLAENESKRDFDET
jgi:ring-1,2-phenylacetyl-CoA epoxidase subunit PaaB